MAFQRVGLCRDVPVGSGLRATLHTAEGEIEIGLYRVGEQYHAMENRCPHRDFPLHRGRLCGAVISCAAHGWEFDVRTGFRPEDADGWPLPCFAVEVIGEEIHVDPDQVINRRTHRRPTRG